jgi:peroxiredoxin
MLGAENVGGHHRFIWPPLNQEQKLSMEIGDEAPDFTLSNTEGEQVSLSDFRGKTSVTIVFIPFAFTGVCEGELCEIRDNLSSFNQAGSEVLAISCDRAPSLKEWKSQQGFNFQMLSDGWPHGEVARAYDCFNEELGCAMRRTVIVGTDGLVKSVFTSGGLGEARPFENYTEGLATI